MNLHEYQAKQLFQRAGVAVPQGVLIEQMDDLPTVQSTLGGDAWVVKAQVHAGGRGKAGGVRLVKGAEELSTAVGDLLGKKLATHQSGAEGLPIDSVWVEALTDIDRELYLSVLVDRATQRVTFVASAAGGMDIETVAAQTPEQIHTVSVPPAMGFSGFMARRLGFALGLEKNQLKAFAQTLNALYDLFISCDASLLEINPLVVTQSGEIVALDAKINLDSNALYRHADLLALRDIRQEDAREAEAAEHELNYVHLDGNIGCMVNGAGLAMATMDLIKLHGGEPANFLDVGGGATADRVAEAFKLILSDTKVRAVLVNIFGGIVRCDLIAQGIIQAIETVDVSVPVVVRLEGTNAEQGRQLLADSGLNVIAAEGLTEAAEQVVGAAQ